MLLEVKEDSVCILVEKSGQTEQFIPSVKEMLVGLLLEKSDHGSFRFNVAYFDKEPVFWADQVTQCTSEKANMAAQWIRSWANTGGESGPHTMMAIVAAFNDPFLGAIYLLTSSLPFDSPNDLINHAKYASKDRPIHVVFLTARSRVDDRAMEILHALSRKTGGSFRVIYYDENGSKTGRLVQVSPFEGHRSKMLINNGSESSLAVSPVSFMDTSPTQRTRFHQSEEHTFPTSPSIDSYSDIIIKTPKSGLERPNSTLGRDIVIHTGRIRSSHSVDEPMADSTNHQDNFFRAENTEIFDHDSARSAEIDDIKKEFAEFYWRKQKREGSARSPTHHQQLMHSKSVEFDPTVSHARRHSLSSPIPDSILSSSSDDDLLEKYSPKKATPKSHGHGTEGISGSATGSIRFTPNSRPPTGRNIRTSTPVTIYSKSHYSPIPYKVFSLSPHPRQSPVSTSRSGLSTGKPAWRPATGRKHFMSSPKNDRRTGVEDRSRAWMNRWMNDWVNKHEPKHGPNRAHASVQVEADKEMTIRPLHRSKSEPRKLQMTTYTQTPHEEKKIGEEIHTIRELLTHNNHLLDSLNRSGRTPRKSPVRQVVHQQTSTFPLRKGISSDFGRLHLTDPPTERIAAIPTHHYVGPSRRPLVTGLQHSTSFHEPFEVDPPWGEWEQGHKTRRDQFHSAIQRKEDIRRQQAEACYKAMYQKLAGDLTRRNMSDDHLPVRNVSRDKMEVIARLPYDDPY